jgi:hypothetical protein
MKYEYMQLRLYPHQDPLQKIIEASEQGYEWFGTIPGKEAAMAEHVIPHKVVFRRPLVDPAPGIHVAIGERHNHMQRHAALQDYLKAKLTEGDWHGVRDAAADLEVLEARYPETRSSEAP